LGKAEQVHCSHTEGQSLRVEKEEAKNPFFLQALLSKEKLRDQEAKRQAINGTNKKSHSANALPPGTRCPQVDYRSFLDKMWEAMPAAEFITMASDAAVLGDPLLMTQHFIGGSRWEKVAEDEIVGWHQLRVPHQRYTDASRQTIAVKGHAHSTNKHWYRRVDGEWKFAGLSPNIRWFEYDFDKVFESGREAFGEDAATVDATADATAAATAAAVATTASVAAATTMAETKTESILSAEAVLAAKANGIPAQ
jgi:scytalone dehydratase